MEIILLLIILQYKHAYCILFLTYILVIPWNVPPNDTSTET